MYKNKVFDEYVRLIQNDKAPINLTQVEYTVLRAYSNQVMNNINPFNILLIDDFGTYFDRDGNVQVFLDFLYRNGAKQFVFAEESTATMRYLVSMLEGKPYRVNVIQGVTWKKSYGVGVGVIVEIVKARKV